MIFNKKRLKNTLLLLLLTLFSLGLKAQIKIGTNPEVVNKAAIFELESADRGILFPRVSLTSTTTWGLISGSTPVAGMVVYNIKSTADGFVGSASHPASLPDGTGLYYWDGTGWLMMKGVNEKITDFSSSSTDPGLFTFTNELGAKTIIKITQSADGDPIANSIIGKAGDIYVDKISGDLYTFNGTNWIKSNASLSMDLASETSRATTAEAALEANKEDKANKSIDVNLADVTNTKFPTELAVKTYVDAKSTTISADLLVENTRATAAEALLEANKEDKANKSTDGTLATNSDVKFPTEQAVKTYVDAKSTTIGADLLTEKNRATAAEALLEANKEDKANKSTDVNLADATNTKFPTELAVKTYVDAKSTTIGADLLTEMNRATAAEAALETNKEDKANKSTDVNLADATNTKFPTELAVKTYVDAQVTSATPTASNTTLGKIKLAGDLAGSNDANLPTITNDAITSVKIKDGEVQSPDIMDANVTATKLATDAVETLKIKDLNVTTNKLADASVTVSKIKNGANNTVLVTDNSGAVAWINSSDFGAIADLTSIEGAGTSASPFKVKDLGIITAKIANDAVTTAKIADANVTNAKLDKTNIPLSGFGAAAADVALGGNKLTGLANPVNAQDATTKAYVDAATSALNTLADGKIYVGDGSNAATEVPVTGDVTMNNAGVTTIGASKVVTTMIADANVTNAKLDKTNIPLSGFGAAAADVALGGNKLTGLANPVNAQDATTKAYVDAATSALNTLADGKIYVGDGSNAATEVPVTGDVTMNNAGVTTIGASKVVTTMIADANVTNAKLDKTNIPLSGFGAAAADVALGGNKLTGLANPINAQDATTKAYVDAATSALNTLADGKIYVGDGSNAATEVAVTGDVSMNNAGVTTIGANKVVTTMIADANVTTAKIASGGNEKVLVTDASGVVTWLDKTAFGAIADQLSVEGAGTSASPFKVKDLGIITDKIADFAVSNAKLAANSVSTDKIVDATILVDDLANGAVETAKIKDLNITTAKIADANITNSKLGNDAITTDKIKDGEVQTDDIKDANVTTAKIANANVTTAKIAPGSFNQVLITDGTGAVIWLDKTAFGAVADLSTIEGSGTSTSPFKVKDLAITTAKLASDAVTTAQILNETILTEDIAANAITSAKLADNAVNSAKILNGTIVNEDIADATITTAKISGTIAIAQGGTGATTAPDALTNLGAEALANKATAINMGGTDADDVKYPTQLAVKTFVENTVNNSVGSSTQTALNLKEDVSNKSTVVDLGTSDVLYPTQNAVKTYVDTKFTSPNAISNLSSLPNIANNRILGNTTGAIATPQEIPVTGTGDVVLKSSAEIITPTISSPVLNGTISGTAIVPIAQGGSGADMSTTSGYVKQASAGANFTTVAKIPVADVDGAVRKVNGVVPDANGNVAVIIGRVFTGATVDPNLATSIINASPAKQQSDIYIVADGSNPNNGRTFIYDGTDWLEVATDLSTTDARYVNVAGDTMEGDLIVPATKKITLTDAPNTATDAVNKAYVDGLITSSATPDATTSAAGKIQLAGDLTGTAMSPEIGANKITLAKMATVSSGTILGRSSSGSGNVEALTTIPTSTLPAFTGDVTTSAGSATTTIANNAVTYAKMQDLSAQSLLLGSKSTGGTGVAEISLGTGLSMTDGILNATGGTVTNIAGTSDRITVTNGATTPIVDISANYVGQNSISTLGTITTGTWNGTTISVPNGGTGATTLTGYVIGNGTSAMTASSTIPVADVTGAQTTANLSANITTNTGSTTMYPSVAAVETYVTANATPDATTSDKGKIQLAGDLAGTADAPTVPGLALKAPLASPALTGTPTAPTAAAGTNTTQLATTAFVMSASGTPFYKTGTTTDVLSDKAVNIYTNKSIGIGTNSPTTNLDVVGGFNLRNTAGAAGSGYGIEFNTNSSSPRIDWVYNGNYTGSFAGDPDFFFRLQNSKQGAGGFRFLTNPSGIGIERLTILNNGNIGIGATNPTEKLEVNGNILATSFKKLGGTSAQFLKADGSVDIIAYAPLSSPAFTGTPTSTTPTSGDNSTNIATTAFVTTAINTAATLDATTSATGKIQLAGDLTGTATAPEVGTGKITSAKILDGTIITEDIANASITNAKIGETITVANGGTGATTLTGYIKGTGTTAMTASATIPVADVTGAQTTANLSANITTNTGSTSMYPSVAAVETYVTDNATPNATTTATGKIQLAGDLAGTATAPSVVKIQGVAVNATAPTTNQLLQFDGTEWKPVSKSQILTMETDEFTATAGQTSFTLTSTPLGKIAMFVNGSRVPKAAITISGTSVTYIPANNDAYDLLSTDRVSFDYVY